MRQALIRAAREGTSFERVQVPKTTCERCGSEVYATPDGTPRGHLRATVPGEPLYSAILPTMAECTE